MAAVPPRRGSAYRTIVHAENRLEAIQETEDEALVEAFADATRAQDELLATLLSEELAGRLRRVRTLASTLPEGLLVLDAAARISYLNLGAMRLFGASRADAIGRLPMDLLDRLDADGNAMLPPSGPPAARSRKGACSTTKRGSGDAATARSSRPRSCSRRSCMIAS